MALTKHRLTYDPVSDKGDAVKSHVVASNGDSLTATSGSLNVNLTGSTGSIEVTAVDLDIRDLSAAQDNVAISDGVDTLAINGDGSINVNSTAQGPIRFINSSAATVAVEEDAAPLPVKLQGLTGDLNITAGDLNVQLEHTGANFDSVRIGDGSELIAITPNADLQVVDRADNSILASQVSVADTAPTALLGSQLSQRKHIFIQNNDNNSDLEIGQSGFTKGQGFLIPAGSTLDMRLGPNVVVHAVSDSGTADTRVLELA